MAPSSPAGLDAWALFSLPLPRSPPWTPGLAVTDSKWDSCWESADLGGGNVFRESFPPFFIIFVNLGQVLGMVEVFPLVCILPKPLG